VFNLINKETQELILQKTCEVNNASTGKAFVVITENEIAEVEPGFYYYTLHSETRTYIQDYYTVTAKSPMYVDSQYDTFAIIEVGQHIRGEPTNSVTIDEFKEVIVSANATTVTNKFFLSSIINARPNLTVPASVHTFQFNVTDYYGTIEIQASQDEGANPQQWITIENISTNNDSNTLYKNIIGKYSWFRIKNTPNLLLPTSGSLDTILYR
jgi:hypothetical protein